VSNGAPELTINGTDYSVSDVTNIQPAATANTASTTPAASTN